jgi:hypothetical protein
MGTPQAVCLSTPSVALAPVSIVQSMRLTIRLFFNDFWHSWEVDVDNRDSIELIWSNVNSLGVAMLNHLQCGEDIGVEMCLADWIATLQKRYEFFLTHADPQLEVDTDHRLPGLYNVLYTLDLRFAAEPRSVYTLTVEALHDEGCSLLKVSTSAMSGNIVCEGIWPITASIGVLVQSVLRQLELPFRVASDHNLYTRAEFVAHYGPDTGENRWTDADALPGCDISFVAEGGTRLDPAGNDALLVTLLPRNTR